MMLTDCHARLYAAELLCRHPADSVDTLPVALTGSPVDLNPHQVDAALFAFRSPLSKGAILADEVGLGKTIEAGIVVAQKWAERKRAVLVIAPAALRTQWRQELEEKFFLPCVVMDRKLFEAIQGAGIANPFHSEKIVIASYEFACRQADCIRSLPWDLVIVDEAHRLRNVYKKGSGMARTLKLALGEAPKLLLTATPLQNSLQELYGLVSFVDDYVFGDIKTFRKRYTVPDEAAFADLKKRLAPLCKRTLRRQVVEYVRYTERRAYTQDFTPFPEEEELYARVSAFLQRDRLWSLPSGRRGLMVLVLRKLLASSSFAIAGALRSMLDRLDFILYHYAEYKAGERPPAARLDALAADAEYLALADEDLPLYGMPGEDIPTRADEESIREEIHALRMMLYRAEGIEENAKGTALLQALQTGFRMTDELGGAPRAVIFTESRRTQAYLHRLLSDNGYADRIVLFNGTNDSKETTALYREWKARHAGTDAVTGSREVDVRSALVEAFRNERPIMIATEAASEGINLQFCSLVINYDLPWNPQRIEQRIGRCHRYGQRHDVVVVNFLNRNNAADQRVFEILSEKFRLFSGVFGASDEVLGSIESGVDFEKRIAEIYQTCRTPQEIEASFDALQASLADRIDRTLQDARRALLENFDVEVAEKLRVYRAETQAAMDRYQTLFWELTAHEVRNDADFDPAHLRFILRKAPLPDVPTGAYSLGGATGYAYHPGHPLARWVLERAAGRVPPPAELVFQLAEGKRIGILDAWRGCSGLLSVRRLTLSALEAAEHIFCLAVTDDGRFLDAEQTRRLFDLPALERSCAALPPGRALDELFRERKVAVLAEASARSEREFDTALDKLERWADERKETLELRLADMDRAVKEARTLARKCASLEDKLAAQRKIKILESRRNDMRRGLFDAQDEVEARKEELLNAVEARLRPRVEEETLFTVRWRLE